MGYPTSPVPCDSCTRALQTCSFPCQLGSHGTFLPHTFCPNTSRGITMKGERSGCQSWSKSRDHNKSSELLCSHTLFTLETSHTGNSATCSTDGGTRYNLINTRVHRCWRFRKLEESSKSNLFHHTAPERIQPYLCHSWLILKQHLMI